MEKMTIEEVLNGLNSIAKELNLPVENEKVFLEWGKRNPRANFRMSREVCEATIFPLYFSSGKHVYAVRYSEKEGRVTHVKPTAEDDWQVVD